MNTVLENESAELFRAHPVARRADPAHIPALDGIRGLAILLVMMTHFILIQKGSKIDVIVGAIGRFGWCGVDLFFVLSGFLITGILYDSKGSQRYFRNFYARRTLRIFPLYYFVVFVSLVVLPRLGSFGEHFGHIGKTWPTYWLYLSNFAIAFTKDINHGVLALTWSLAIEEQFYLLWPLIVLSFGRQTLMKICGAAVAVAILSRTALVLAGPSQWLPWVPYNITICRMDGLAIGAFVALALRGPASIRSLLRPAKFALPICIIALFAIIGYHRSMHWIGGPGQTIGYTVLGLIFATILVLTLNDSGSGVARRFFTQRWLRFLGKYSYGLYLFHFPAHIIIHDWVYGPDQFLHIGSSRVPGQLIYIVLSFALSLAMALLSWHLLEKRFLALKRFFPSNAGRSPATPVIPQVPALQPA
jgi:peptidoglycan/LPS O-acetylase OafA/YrhL